MKKKKAAASKKRRRDESESESEEESESESKEEEKKSGKSKSKAKAKPPAQKQKSSGGLEDSSKLADDEEDALNAMKVDELKERLRANDQATTGNKDDLVARIRDCVKNGCFPRCPAMHSRLAHCFGGRLRKQGEEYVCQGYFDDDKYMRCRYRSKTCDRTPWVKADGQPL